MLRTVPSEAVQGPRLACLAKLSSRPEQSESALLSLAQPCTASLTKATLLCSELRSDCLQTPCTAKPCRRLHSKAVQGYGFAANLRFASRTTFGKRSCAHKPLACKSTICSKSFAFVRLPNPLHGEAVQAAAQQSCARLRVCCKSSICKQSCARLRVCKQGYA